jgi:tripartite-type tricarboxylate transporter receptor subunit TctC
MTGPLFRLLAILTTAACVAAPAFAQPVGPTPVPTTDLNMVVALDRSESVDLTERAAQNESLAAALIDPRFIAAVKGGWQGRIGIAVLTWSSTGRRPISRWRSAPGSRCWTPRRSRRPSGSST